MSRLSRDPWFDTPDGRDVRAHVLKRDNHACARCGSPAHQIAPVDFAGPRTADNLAATCRRCLRKACFKNWTTTPLPPKA